MSDLPLHIEKIAGQGTGETFCATFTKRITLQDGSLGTIVSCFLVKSGEAQDLGVVVSDLFELTTKKLEEVNEGPYEAMSIVSDSCLDFAKEKAIEADFAHIFFFKSASYIVRIGDKIKISVFEPPKSLDITFESGSGVVKAGQIYLVGTEKFLSFFDKSLLSSGKSVDLEAIVDGLATDISTFSDQSEIGAAFVLVEGSEGDGLEEKEDKEEVVDDKELASDLESPVGTGEIEVTEESEGMGVESDSEGGENKDNEESLVDVREVERPVVEQARRVGLVSFAAFTSGILRFILYELKSLRRGDIKAIFRLRRNIVALALIVLVILALSGAYTIRNKSQREKLAKFNEHLTGASSKYSEGVAIIELNKSRARQILIEAEAEIKSALSIFENNENAKKLSLDISAKLKETETLENLNLQVFYEASGAISGLTNGGKNLYVLSDDNIHEVNKLDKSTRKFKGPDSVSSGFFYSDNVFVTSQGKIWKVDLKSEKTEEIGDVKDSGDIAVFLGNVYLLLDSQISKLVPVEGGYAAAVDYLITPQKFSESSRFAIDGLIWTTNKGQILKFLRGKKQDFEISGLTGEVGELGAIYTTSDFGNLYVIDRVNSALLVIDKDGVYQKSYQSSEFGKAFDIVVNDDESKVYLSVGSKVLEAPLR